MGRLGVSERVEVKFDCGLEVVEDWRGGWAVMGTWRGIVVLSV